MVSFRSLSARAKKAVDAAGGPDEIKRKAKRALDDAGGSEGVKAKAQDLREVAKQRGSLSDKAKAAAEVVRREEDDPGEGSAVPGKASEGERAERSPDRQPDN